jgi:flagellar biosynthesis/type III secretory pathway M-ring protein FliF/YscJ
MPANQPTKTERLDHIKNYEIDKRTRRLESPHARIKRMSVGVVVHDALDYDGNPTMTDEALERYRSLVAKAVGIDLKRGDEVEVIAMPFYGVAPEIQPVLPPLYLNPYFIGASIFGLFALLLGVLIFTRARKRQRELQAALLEAQQPDILEDFEGEEFEATGAVDEEQIQMETRIVKLRETALALSDEDLSTVSQIIEGWLESGGDLDAEEQAA